MANLKKIIKKCGPETASEIVDLNSRNISILDENVQLVNSETDLTGVKEDIQNLKVNKQDKLTEANAGKNITITEEKGITKINAVAEIPDINGDNITATINGENKFIKDAISANETNIEANKQLIDKNTADIKTINGDIVRISDQQMQNTKDIATNKEEIAKKRDNEITYSPDLETDPVQAGLGDIFYNTSDPSYIRSYHSAQNKRLDSLDTAFNTTAKTVELLDEHKADKDDVVAKAETIVMDVEFKDGTKGSYKVIKNA